MALRVRRPRTARGGSRGSGGAGGSRFAWSRGPPGVSARAGSSPRGVGGRCLSARPEVVCASPRPAASECRCPLDHLRHRVLLLLGGECPSRERSRWGGEARGAPGGAAARRALPWVAPLRPVPMEQTSALPPGVLDGRDGKKFHVRFVRPELSGGRLSPSVVPRGSGLAPWHLFATERGSGFLRTLSNSFSCCTAFFSCAVYGHTLPELQARIPVCFTALHVSTAGAFST